MSWEFLEFYVFLYFQKYSKEKIIHVVYTGSQVTLSQNKTEHKK